MSVSVYVHVGDIFACGCSLRLEVSGPAEAGVTGSYDPSNTSAGNETMSSIRAVHTLNC